MNQSLQSNCTLTVTSNTLQRGQIIVDRQIFKPKNHLLLLTTTTWRGGRRSWRCYSNCSRHGDWFAFRTSTTGSVAHSTLPVPTGTTGRVPVGTYRTVPYSTRTYWYTLGKRFFGLPVLLTDIRDLGRTYRYVRYHLEGRYVPYPSTHSCYGTVPVRTGTGTGKHDT